MDQRPRRRLALHAGVVLAAFAVAYWTAVGQGFISDDFRWILESRLRQAADIKRLFVDTTGFYRPVVALVFGATDYFAGPDPRAFGRVTFTFALLCACAVAVLARSLRLPAGAALLAGSLWLLNPHGINMSILWMSGLTALCLVLFGTLSAIAVAHGRWLMATPLFFAALLSKEEAILLPLPLVLIAVLRARGQAWRIWPLAAGLVAAEIVYFALRSRSDAMTPGSAPSFYRFTFAIGDVAANALQYADRSLTLAAAVVLIVAMLVRVRPRLDPAERQAVAIGATWLVTGFGITLFLPVRSSLYALFPSVGGAIAASALVAAFWRQASVRQRKVLQVMAIVLPICLTPVLRARTARWTELARVSRITVEAVTPSIGRGTTAVLFVDDRSRRDNLENAFGSLLPDALELFSSTRPQVWMVPAPSDAAPEQLEPVPPVSDAWRYQDGRIERIDPAGLIGAPALRLR
ncbi:MAG: hypothetical protein WD690_11375 [Vicinamibacterales bacterium]